MRGIRRGKLEKYRNIPTVRELIKKEDPGERERERERKLMLYIAMRSPCQPHETMEQSRRSFLSLVANLSSYGRRPALAFRDNDHVTSALIVYTSSSRWDFIILPMSSTVATKGKKVWFGDKRTRWKAQLKITSWRENKINAASARITWN